MTDNDSATSKAYGFVTMNDDMLKIILDYGTMVDLFNKLRI